MTIHGGFENSAYGIYRGSLPGKSAGTWELLGAGYSGKTYVFTQQPNQQAFYALGDLVTGPQAAGPVIQASSVPTRGFSHKKSADVPAQTTSQDATIEESWLARHFGANWRGNPAAAAHADPDGDGVNNHEEYRRGRNPLVRAVADTEDRAKLRVYSLLK